MWREILGLIKRHDDLLEEASHDSIDMLVTVKEMFSRVVNVMHREADESALSDLRKIDWEINSKQRAVRKKVFEHLAISQGEGLLTGLILVSIVIDLERIGDYTKNMADLKEMLPGGIDEEEYSKQVEELVLLTEKLFDQTLEAFRDSNKTAASTAAKNFSEISQTCNRVLKECFSSTAGSPMVPKSMLAVVLVLRYVKRVSAHLHNIASATGGPFHRIGYKFHDRNKK